MARYAEYPENMNVAKANPERELLQRIDWDNYYLKIADAVARRGDCTRRQIGAVLVWGQRIWSTGYNGTIPGGKSCLKGHCPRGQKSTEEVPPYADYKDCIAIHAEENAYMQFARIWALVQYWVAREQTGKPEQPQMYVSAAPCDNCAELLESKGVISVWRDEAGNIVRSRDTESAG